MILYTIGFAQKSAEKFFSLINDYYVQILVDIRLHSNSQLSGFARGRDLKYFLRELCSCEYQHCIKYAPTQELLDGYRNGNITWRGYEREFTRIMANRHAVDDFMTHFGDYLSVCLLCSEATPEKCHRRLFAEMIKARDPNTLIIHL